MLHFGQDFKIKICRYFEAELRSGFEVQFDHDFEAKVWYRFDVEFWGYFNAVTLVKELDPRVRCAFGNVFVFICIHLAWLRGKEVKVGHRELLEPKYKEEGGKEEWVFRRALAPPPHMNKRKIVEVRRKSPKKSCPLFLSLMLGKGQGKGKRWRDKQEKTTFADELDKAKEKL